MDYGVRNMTTHKNGPEIGQSAPHITLNDDNNMQRTFNTLMGEAGLLLIFVNGTWCPTCVGTLYYLSKHTPHLTKMGVNTSVVAVDDAGTLRAFRLSASLPLTYTLLADPNEVARSAYGVTASEVYLLLDRQGTVHERFFDPAGYMRPSRAKLEASIQAMLAAGV